MQQFTAAGTDTVGADGIATVAIGPNKANETWDVVKVSVILDGSTDGEIYLYEGGVSPGNFLEASYVGVRNSSAFVPGTLVLSPNEYLSFQWIEATPGAIATARVRYALR